MSRAGQATYNRVEGVVRAPGPVSFSKGTLTGTSVGMTYDETRDILSLLDQAVVKVAPGKDPRAAAPTSRPERPCYARRDKYMRFDRGVRLLREGRTVEADAATAFLSDDGEPAAADGAARATRASRPPARRKAPSQAMTARDMDLAYAPDGETLNARS